MIQDRTNWGRNSAGPRPTQRRLTVEEVTAERDRILSEPASPARTMALTRCRRQMASIRNRVADHG